MNLINSTDESSDCDEEKESDLKSLNEISCLPIRKKSKTDIEFKKM